MARRIWGELLSHLRWRRWEHLVRVTEYGVLWETIKYPEGTREGELTIAWHEIYEVFVYGCNLDDTDWGRPDWTIVVQSASNRRWFSSAFGDLDTMLQPFGALHGFDLEAARRTAQTRSGAVEPLNYHWERSRLSSADGPSYS